MNKKGQIQLVPLIVIVILVLYFLNTSLSPKVTEIIMDNGKCSKLNVDIGRGTTMKWVNRGNQAVELDFSLITAPPVKTTVAPDATYSVEFTAPGRFVYYCAGIQAEVNVK